MAPCKNPDKWGTSLTPVGSVDNSGVEGSSRLDKIKDLWATAKDDLSRASWKGKVALGSLLLIASYEWSGGNETATPIVGGRVLGLEDGLEGVALTASVTGGFIASQQLAAGYLTRKTAEQFPSVGEKMYRIINRSTEDSAARFVPFNDLSAQRKFLYSFTLGSSFNVLRETAVTGKMDQEHLKKVSRSSAAITGGSVAVLGAGVEVVNQQFENDANVQFAMSWVVKNPVFWLGLMGAILSMDYLKNRRYQTNKIANT